jgi:type III pantothenate kinase
MLLAVDIGNTNVVLGLYDGEQLSHTFRVSTVLSRTEDEYGVLIVQLLGLAGLDPKLVSAAIVASVVPPLTDVISAAIRRVCARDPAGTQDRHFGAVREPA